MQRVSVVGSINSLLTIRSVTPPTSQFLVPALISLTQSSTVPSKRLGVSFRMSLTHQPSVVGAGDGSFVGSGDGSFVGSNDGVNVGRRVGNEGARVGIADGAKEKAHQTNN